MIIHATQADVVNQYEGKMSAKALYLQLVSDKRMGFLWKSGGIRKSEVFQDEKIVVTLLRQLSWSHRAIAQVRERLAVRPKHGKEARA
jgi:hypothetical protein